MRCRSFEFKFLKFKCLKSQNIHRHQKKIVTQKHFEPSWRPFPPNNLEFLPIHYSGYPIVYSKFSWTIHSVSASVEYFTDQFPAHFVRCSSQEALEVQGRGIKLSPVGIRQTQKKTEQLRTASLWAELFSTAKNVNEIKQRQQISGFTAR